MVEVLKRPKAILVYLWDCAQLQLHEIVFSAAGDKASPRETDEGVISREHRFILVQT